jgi:hypothetical protein
MVKYISKPCDHPDYFVRHLTSTIRSFPRDIMNRRARMLLGISSSGRIWVTASFLDLSTASMFTLIPEKELDFWLRILLYLRKQFGLVPVFLIYRNIKSPKF